MKLEDRHSSDEKRRWKIVLTKDYKDYPEPYEIETADDVTGECKISIPKPDGSGSESKTLSYGPGGCRIIRRRR